MQQHTPFLNISSMMALTRFTLKVIKLTAGIFFLPHDFGFFSTYTQISGMIRRLMKCYFCFTDTSTPRKSRSNVKNVGRDSVSPEL